MTLISVKVRADCLKGGSCFLSGQAILERWLRPFSLVYWSFHALSVLGSRKPLNIFRCGFLHYTHDLSLQTVGNVIF